MRVCVCTYASMRALRIVSMDRILCFTNTLIIINKKNSLTHNPLTLWDVFVNVHLHMPDDPQRVQLRKATANHHNQDLKT